MITLKEIAKLCNVSTTTVSYVINGKPKVSEETKNKVLDIIKETGYQPNYFAQGIRKQKSSIIGIITEDLAQFSSPGIIEGIMSYCESRHFKTILENMRLYDRWGSSWFDQEKQYNSILEPSLQQMLSIKVDGIIYVAGHARIINCFPKDFNLPGVITYAYSGNKRYPSIVIDDEKGSYEATRYLLHNGHKKIGVIGGQSSNIHTQKRALGYQKALFEEKIPYNPDWIKYCDWTREGGYHAAQQLLCEDISAIFVMNDIMAGGVYDYLYEHQLTPGKEISVIGYDNREVSEFIRPSLTSMAIPLSTIGIEAAKIMIDLLDSEESNISEYTYTNTEIRIPCQLIERASVRNIN